jgi:hypothetical protein
MKLLIITSYHEGKRILLFKIGSTTEFSKLSLTKCVQTNITLCFFMANDCK